MYWKQGLSSDGTLFFLILSNSDFQRDEYHPGQIGALTLFGWLKELAIEGPHLQPWGRRAALLLATCT